MDQEFPYLVLAYYQITPIEDPQLEVERHHLFFKGEDVKSRIYLSQQGINGQMSASIQSAQNYMNWMKEDPRFADMNFKISKSKEHVFPKTTVKVRKQLVALDRDVDLAHRGVSVSAGQWREMLEQRDERTIVIDVRNSYEWAVGHFEGAELPLCESFREFPAYVETLKERQVTQCMIYCTGGIRCEYASALLLQERFDAVYQLKGGIIEYGVDQGARHWKGKLFVFDDRLVVPISEEEKEPIGTCRHCGGGEDVYFNCANKDCNALFLCCIPCLHQKLGCCSSSCMQSKGLRPYRSDGSSKPFRRRGK